MRKINKVFIFLFSIFFFFLFLDPFFHSFLFIIIRYTEVAFPERGPCSKDKQIVHQYSLRVDNLTATKGSGGVVVTHADILQDSCLNGWTCTALPHRHLGTPRGLGGAATVLLYRGSAAPPYQWSP